MKKRSGRHPGRSQAEPQASAPCRAPCRAGSIGTPRPAHSGDKEQLRRGWASENFNQHRAQAWPLAEGRWGRSTFLSQEWVRSSALVLSVHPAHCKHCPASARQLSVPPPTQTCGVLSPPHVASASAWCPAGLGKGLQQELSRGPLPWGTGDFH